jgi:hypothetical protein
MYRLEVISRLPQVEKLDEDDVLEDEREEAQLVCSLLVAIFFQADPFFQKQVPTGPDRARKGGTGGGRCLINIVVA